KKFRVSRAARSHSPQGSVARLSCGCALSQAMDGGQGFMSALGVMGCDVALSIWRRALPSIAVAMLVLLVGACEAQTPSTPKESMTGVGITGIDHLADYLSVQEFSVNGYKAGQAGKGGSTVCCAMLPVRWRPG